MAALFTGKVLMANREEYEVETERELGLALENKVLLLYFGSEQCPRCRRFSPLLKDFFLRLTDEFYVERASQLVLVYVSQDETEEQQSAFLKTMPKRWLAVPFGDDFKRELELRFAVAEVPAVVVLKPNGEVIVGNAVEEIQRLGPACFQNWKEAAELVDRNFRLAEDFDDCARRSITDPIRRLKYKLDKKRGAKKRRDEEEEDEEESS
ncbi:Nucleoredoxin-like 1 [Mesitornis unicolor]|uniref:Nucleoredoxin-like 1 n=1 Tax=Mesitornis unicolor TaxID=54374 RepID=A0A091QTK4_9AVES|nr:PREDICTED: nucleoredoxin-like protein 1 [Mesitornis unicolor]KFQ30870.1 Nucleoredoxin-like 1 [Mesitornis unicolor]